MLTRSCYKNLTLFVLLFSVGQAQAGLWDILNFSKVTYNRDGSVTYKSPQAHNGSDYFPIRYDGQRDFDLACKLMGHDLALREPGLNRFSSSSSFKLMFNKDGSLEDLPVKEGNVITKITCYQVERIKSSVHAKVNKNDDGSYTYSNIYFLRGDLKFWIAYDDSASETQNFDKICRLLDKRASFDSDYALSLTRNRNGLRAIVDEAPKFTKVMEARSFISQVTCTPEQLPIKN